ncbi:MAG: HD-GYP domain-containing protein [Chloroflexota bacterium]
MRKIRISELQPDMVIAKPVYGADGQLLLNVGVKIMPGYVRQLERLGIPAVYIADERMSGVVVDDVVSDRTRLNATAAVRDVLDAVRVRTQKELSRSVVFADEEIRSAMNRIIDDLLRNPNVVISLTDIRTNDDYTFGHSVNVAILCVMMGMAMNYNEARLHDLGLGAIMHDIGKVRLPEAILKKQGPLTPAELEEMQKHPTYGFNILRSQPNLSILTAHVAYQHHERLNGEGYPRRLRAGEIHEFARIAAVADVYDALVTDRVTRRGFTPGEALQMLQGISQYYDQDAVKALAGCVALYPVGTLVELNTREQGLVTSTRKGASDRPTVRVVYDWSGQELKRPYDVDLYLQNDLFITKTVFRTAPGAQPESARFEGVRQLL